MKDTDDCRVTIPVSSREAAVAVCPVEVGVSADRKQQRDDIGVPADAAHIRCGLTETNALLDVVDASQGGVAAVGLTTTNKVAGEEAGRDASGRGLLRR